MTVEQLISELQKFDPKMEVKTEGCDCTGESAYVTLEEGWKGQDEHVMICRTSFETDDEGDYLYPNYKNDTIQIPYKEPKMKEPCICGATDWEKCFPIRPLDKEEQYDFDWEDEGYYWEEE